MKPKFFCDENITKKIQKILKESGFDVDSIRSKKLFGMTNGELVKYLNENNYTIITFDKDFLEFNINVKGGIIVIDIHPNRDEYSIPLVRKFIKLLEDEG